MAGREPEMGSSFVRGINDRLSLRFVRRVNKLLQMTERPRRWFGVTVKMIIGATMIAMVYDVFAPIYADMEITNANRVDEGIEATIKFQKIRDCKPITGSVVAFAHFFEGYRLPAKVLDNHGEVVVLRNFPPSDEPVFIDYTWIVAKEMPEVSFVSLGFYIRCKTRIPQFVEWRSKASPVQ